MSDVVGRISKRLRSRHDVNEFFYPNISMDLDLPNGFEGEINGIAKLLEKNGFQTTTENVLQVMKFKKELMHRYTGTSEGKFVLEEYNTFLLKHVKPVGIAIPLEVMFVTGLAALVLFVGARFLGSFADEAGKIAARKLLDKEKKLSKEHNMTIEEYRFIKNQTIILIEKGDDVDSLIRKLRKKKE